MGYAYRLPELSPETTRNVASLLRVIIILLIAGAAVSSRLFAVVRHESVIHEFDPWFNFRATKVLTEDGFYRFWNWFDEKAWYPLGRAAGGTLYPGLMVTSGSIYNFLRVVNIPVDIRNVCVLLAPAFSGLTAWATYKFTANMKDDAAGLLAAAFIGIAPGYISRSVAGSYDNEAIAIFLLMMVFHLWIKALKDGSVMSGVMCALFYFYMVAAWGGYVFITNVIPLHAFALILMGRFSTRLYVAFSSYYVVGTLASMQVPFVGHNPVTTSEHMAPMGVFGLLQLCAFAEFVRSLVPSKQFKVLLRSAVAGIFLVAFSGFIILSLNGKIAPWTGRFYSLWDTGYAKKHLPLIASVSEHQPPAWPAFFFDLEMLIFLFPAGVYLLFRQLRDEHIFVILYAVTCSYFASVMVRLMLTLTPIVCVSAAVAISTLLDTYLDPKEPDRAPQTAEEIESSSNNAGSSTPKKSGGKKGKSPVAEAKSKAKAQMSGIYGLDTRIVVSVYTLILLLVFVLHCTFVTSTAYSSPSVVLASRNPDGSQHIIDDFREAYYWLRQNTPVDAKVMSWWDYGYQIAGMADRPTLVDNNTWNNTHIATVGRMMSTSEAKSEPYLRKHDVDYVLVIFGGLLGFSGDDINKFLWMIRISGGIWPEDIREVDFFSPRGEYRIDDGASQTMKDSLMYKMSYYRFNELFGNRPGMDRVRGTSTASQSPKLDILDEAFTSENWIVRIYQVKKEDPLGRSLSHANAFDRGERLTSPVARTSSAPGSGGTGSAGSRKRKGKKAVVT
ncbi:unnamed protein product [Jaminaea pallidilutea]